MCYYTKEYDDDREPDEIFIVDMELPTDIFTRLREYLNTTRLFGRLNNQLFVIIMDRAL